MAAFGERLALQSQRKYNRTSRPYTRFHTQGSKGADVIVVEGKLLRHTLNQLYECMPNIDEWSQIGKAETYCELQSRFVKEKYWVYNYRRYCLKEQVWRFRDEQPATLAERDWRAKFAQTTDEELQERIDTVNRVITTYVLWERESAFHGFSHFIVDDLMLNM